MKFLVVSYSCKVGDLSVFVQEFCNVLAEGHDVYFHGKNPLIVFEGQLHEETEIIPDKYDGAYIFHFEAYPDLTCKKAFFVINDIISKGYRQNIENVMRDDSNFVITVNSDLQKQQLLEMGIDGSLIVNIPVYINEYIFKPDNNITKLDRSIVMVNVADYSEQVVPLIEAMTLMPDYRLTIMSDEPIPGTEIRNDTITVIPKLVGTEKRDEIIKHTIAIGTGRSSEESVLSGMPTLLFNDSFTGYITDTTIGTLEDDNFSGRYSLVVDDSAKSQMIIDAINNPKTFDLNFAIQRLGLVTNIADYINLTV